MCKTLIAIGILMLFLPWVQSGITTCSPSTLGSDAEGCIQGIASNLNLRLAVAGALKDFAQCVLDGTTTQCQYECTIGFLAAGCEGENYDSCMSEQTQNCWKACDGNINVFNQGCFSASLDVASMAPEVGGIIALAGVFFSCVDIAGCGVSWALGSIINVALTLSQDAKNEFCTLLHKIVGENAILSGLLSLFNC